MKRNLVCALAAIAISRCAPDSVRPAGKLPPITNPAEAGDVVLIRPRAFIADETSFYINVNQDDIAPIRSGQQTEITQRVVAGQTAYLTIAPNKDCVSVEP